MCAQDGRHDLCWKRAAPRRRQARIHHRRRRHADRDRRDARCEQGEAERKVTANLDTRYETSLGRSGLRGFIRDNVYYRDKVTFQLVPRGTFNPYVQPDFAIVSGSIGVIAGGGKYTISAFVKNLFDQNYVTSIFDLPLDANGRLGQFVTRDAERTIGGSVRVRF